jgi:large subunit ribosomal protein L39e
MMDTQRDNFNNKVWRDFLSDQHLKGGILKMIKMAARKNTSRKKRLIKRIKQNRPVPAWVIIRTHRHVRTNPKRRAWRKSDVGVG